MNTPSGAQKAAKLALVTWLEENHISIKEFGDAMDYGYTYAWALVRGNAVITTEFLGRLVNAYGGEIADQISKILNGEAIVEPTE